MDTRPSWIIKGSREESVHQFMELEKRCCPFFLFELVIEGGDFRLSITGKEGVKQFLQTQFRLTD